MTNLTARQIVILSHLKANYARYKDTLVHVYIHFDWDELSDLAKVSNLVIHQTPERPNMWLSGRHLISPAIEDFEGISLQPDFRERESILIEIACNAAIIEEGVTPLPMARGFHYQLGFMEAELLLNIRQTKKEMAQLSA